jgi:hypothetical protein
MRKTPTAHCRCRSRGGQSGTRNRFSFSICAALQE